MAETVVLAAEARPGNGTRGARKLRKKGQIPGVVYGHKEATVSVAVAADDLHQAIRRGARVLDLNHGGKVEKALIRDVQWDALGHYILHVDFARVSEDERITLDVRVELRGTAPGIVAGGVLVQQIHQLHVECPVISVPDSIRVNVGELQIGQSVQVKHLTLPPGVKVNNDPEAIIVAVSLKAVEPTETAAITPTAEQAEPEVISKKKEEEPAEEE
ncbi:MAG: 50S ribosomal protein L25 [Gemmataceae bacterium]|nr:50S ribosomal protein L25 [Gemmataceae bacterium]